MYCLVLAVLMGIALQAAGTGDGWVLEPSGRVGWQAWAALTGADWRLRDGLTWSFGVGLGLTDARIVLKSRFEFEFGRKHN